MTTWLVATVKIGDMTIQRMDNVGIVVDDLDAAVAFFTEIGMELEGKRHVEGIWVDRTVGLDGVRSDIAMMRTPDSKLELSKYGGRRGAREPSAQHPGPASRHVRPAMRSDPQLTPALRRIRLESGVKEPP